MRRRSVLVLAASSVAALIASGCGGGDDSSSDLDFSAMCAEVEDVGGVPTCTQPHDGAEPVRLPADPSDTVRLGALVRGGGSVATRGGSLPLAESLRTSLAGDQGAGSAEYANAVYRVEIEDGTATALTRVAAVDEDVLLGLTFGGAAMEGTIGALASADAYDFEARLPVRLEFADTAADGRITGTVVNATGGVTGADGTCLPALDADPAVAPLQGNYTADVWITRVPSMHAAFDDELVIHWTDDASNMGTAFYPSVATVLGLDPLEPTWEAILHGNPIAGPPLSLELVDGGGEPC